jgi:hypothetical protein
MAKFSEILGGIAKDLVQLQVASDLTSMEFLSHYKDTEILKYLDAPRFKLNEIKMNLKFAISQEVILEQTEASVNYAETEWLNALKEGVINYIPDTVQGLSVSDRRLMLRELEKASSTLGKPDLDIKNALSSGTSTTVTKSTNYVIEIYRKLPVTIRNKLPAINSLKEIVKNKVTDIFERRLPAIKKIASAKSVVERDLEVIVEKEALENINNEQIHEISFSLTPDFIKIVQDEEIK